MQRPLRTLALVAVITATALPLRAQECARYTPPYGVGGVLAPVRSSSFADFGLNVPEAVRLAYAPDGTLYLGTSTTVVVEGRAQFAPLVAAYAPDGRLLWRKNVGARAGRNGWLLDLAVGPDGDAFVTGWSAPEPGTGEDTRDRDGIVARLGTDGTLRWTAVFDGPLAGDDDVAYAVAPAADGAVYVAGWTPPPVEDSGGKLIAAARYSPTGELEWVRAYASDVTFDFGWRAVALPDGGVAVAATDYLTSSNEAIRVIAWDAGGEIAWERVYDYPGAGFPNDLAVGADGSVYVAAQTGAASGSETRFTVLAYAPDGTPAWTYSSAEGTTGMRFAIATGVEVAPDGDVVVAGHRWDEEDVGYRFVLKRFAPGGDVRWSTGYGWGGYESPLCVTEYAHDLALDDAGNAYAAVTTGGYRTGGWVGHPGDFLTLAYAPDGDLTGVAYEAVTASESRSAIAVRGGAVATAGFFVEYPATGHALFFYEAVAATASAAPPSLPPSIGDVVVYPNPSRGMANVLVHLRSPKRVIVAAYDVLGQRIAVLHEGPLAAGEHRLPFDGSGLPSGIYVVRAAGDGIELTRRVTILR